MVSIGHSKWTVKSVMITLRKFPMMGNSRIVFLPPLSVYDTRISVMINSGIKPEMDASKTLTSFQLTLV